MKALIIKFVRAFLFGKSVRKTAKTRAGKTTVPGHFLNSLFWNFLIIVLPLIIIALYLESKALQLCQTNPVFFF
jgi:hypothetical protein